MQCLQIVRVYGVVVRRGVLNPVLHVAGAYARYGTAGTAGRVPGGERLQVVGDTFLLGVGDGESHHRPVTHSQHNRSAAKERFEAY